MVMYAILPIVLLSSYIWCMHLKKNAANKPSHSDMIIEYQVGTKFFMSFCNLYCPPSNWSWFTILFLIVIFSNPSKNPPHYQKNWPFPLNKQLFKIIIIFKFIANVVDEFQTFHKCIEDFQKNGPLIKPHACLFSMDWNEAFDSGKPGRFQPHYQWWITYFRSFSPLTSICFFEKKIFIFAHWDPRPIPRGMGGLASPFFSRACKMASIWTPRDPWAKACEKCLNFDNDNQQPTSRWCILPVYSGCPVGLFCWILLWICEWLL